jgi:peroxiredoxin Q/BCP
VRDARNELASSNLAAVGISPDVPEDQKRFDDKFELGFPLLADADHKIAEAYGVWGEKQTYGRTSIGIKRSSFLVDGEGNLEAVWYNVRPEATVPKALQQVGG